MQDDSVGRDCREIEVRLMKIWHRMWGKYRRGCAKIVPSLWLPIAFFFLRRQWSDVSDNYNDADKKPSRYGTKVGAVPVEAIKASKACWIFGLGSQNEKSIHVLEVRWRWRWKWVEEKRVSAGFSNAQKTPLHSCGANNRNFSPASHFNSLSVYIEWLQSDAPNGGKREHVWANRKSWFIGSAIYLEYVHAGKQTNCKRHLET